MVVLVVVPVVVVSLGVKTCCVYSVYSLGFHRPRPLYGFLLGYESGTGCVGWPLAGRSPWRHWVRPIPSAPRPPARTARRHSLLPLRHLPRRPPSLPQLQWRKEKRVHRVHRAPLTAGTVAPKSVVRLLVAVEKQKEVAVQVGYQASRLARARRSVGLPFLPHTMGRCGW